MSSPVRCPTCDHVYAIHYRDGSCPRWARSTLDGDNSRTRVCIRVGWRWPEYQGHVLAYFPACQDKAAGMVLVLDLTTDERFEAALTTMRGRQTRPATMRERDWAASDLELRMGEKVIMMRNLI